jgi:hypothetical protein
MSFGGIGPGISFDGGGFSVAAPSASAGAGGGGFSGPSLMSTGGTTSFGTDGGGMISVDDATGGVTMDGAAFDMAVPGTDVSTSNMNTYAVLAEQARQEAARQAYEQQQALATELQAGLLDEQARGTQPAMGFTPDGAMAEEAIEEAIRSQQDAEFNTLREAEGGKLYAEPLFDLPVLSLLGPRTIKNAMGMPLPAQTVLANLPYVGGLLSLAMTSGYPDNTFGDFPGDAVSPPSEEEIAAAQQQMQPVMPVPDPVPVVVPAPTASQVYATAQPYYRRTLLDAAPAGFADFAALNDAFTRSYAMRPAIYQTPPAVDLLGRQGFVPLV